MSVNYDHSQDRFTMDGARAALPVILAETSPQSVLDVGCGPGTWAKATLECGIKDVMGIDGVPIPDEQLFIPKSLFRVQDLTHQWSLGRTFDVVFCLEVAEHIEAQYSKSLIGQLIAHAKTVVFAAACPEQPGYHHVNCQWPIYWQELFNEHGYVCDDAIRWSIWKDTRVECWYRQNMFIARYCPERAGKEKRVVSVIHPEMLRILTDSAISAGRKEERMRIENGQMRTSWYSSMVFKALTGKLRRVSETTKVI